MRWFVQISVMAGDLALVFAAGYLIYSQPFNIVAWAILYLAYGQWKETGGFEAWNPVIIKNFFKEAKTIGL